MNRERWIQVIALLMVGGVVWLTASSRVEPHRDATADAGSSAKRGAPVRVQAVNPRTDDLTRIVRLSANVMPWRSTEVYAQVAGAVATEPVEVGTRLSSGGTLLELGVPEVDALVASAEQSILAAQAHVARAEAGVAEAQEGVTKAQVTEKQAQVAAKKAQGMIAAARAEVAKAEAALATRQSIFERLAAARERSPNLVSPEKVDEAKGAFEVAKADVEVARFGVGAAEDNHEVAMAGVTAAQASVQAARLHVKSAAANKAAADAAVKQAESRVGEAQATRGFATLTAPFECVVVSRMVELGQVVRDARRNSGAKPLYRLVDDNRLRLRFFLSMPDAPSARVGNKVRITFDEHPDWPVIEAPIARIADGFDGKTLQMECQVHLWNVFEVDGKVVNLDTSGKFAVPTKPGDDVKRDGRRLLRADTLARVTVDLETRPDVLVVPVSCVKTKKKKSWVMIVTSDGIVQKKTVKIGASDGHQIEIVPPPADDPQAYRMGTSDRVISKGTSLVSDGMRVEAALKEW